MPEIIRWSVCSKVLGSRPMSMEKISHERDFVLCVQRLGRKILEFMKVQYVCGFSCERSLSAVTLLPIFKKFKNISVSQNKTSTFAEV